MTFSLSPDGKTTKMLPGYRWLINHRCQCGQTPDLHVGDKCLFAPGSYTPAKAKKGRDWKKSWARQAKSYAKHSMTRDARYDKKAGAKWFDQERTLQELEDMFPGTDVVSEMHRLWGK